MILLLLFTDEKTYQIYKKMKYPFHDKNVHRINEKKIRADRMDMKRQKREIEMKTSNI
jgi:hypothetical protein